MKNKLNSALKISVLTVVFIFLVLGLFAKSGFHHYESLQKESKDKPQLKTFEAQGVVGFLEKDEVIKQNKDSEKRMIELKQDKVFKQQRHFEEWMYDEYFWQIKTPEWDQEPVEEPYELEDWMFNVELKVACCVDFYSDLKEKKWMKKHNFFIL